MRREGKIFCKRCWYDLRGIESNHCPECGKHFNPRFPNTFLKYDGDTLPKMIWVALSLFLISMALFASAFILSDESWRRAMVMWSLPFLGVAMFYGGYSARLCFRQVRAGWKRRAGALLALLPILVGLYFVGLAVWYHD